MFPNCAYKIERFFIYNRVVDMSDVPVKMRLAGIIANGQEQKKGERIDKASKKKTTTRRNLLEKEYVLSLLTQYGTLGAVTKIRDLRCGGSK